MAGKLKPLDVARQITPGKHADGDGLYLVVASATSRNWSYRYWFKGKERWYGLGSLRDVSLKEARIKRDTARQQVRAGIDIVQAKRSAREELKAVEAITAAPTFRECAEQYIKDNEAKWSPKHAAQWPSSLKAYAYPTIGHLRIGEILPSHIHDLLRPIWIDKRETSNRVRGRIETIIAKNVDADACRNASLERWQEWMDVYAATSDEIGRGTAYDRWNRASEKTGRLGKKILKIKPVTAAGLLVRARVIETHDEICEREAPEQLMAEIKAFAKAA